MRELLDTLLMRVRARYPRLAAVVLGFAGTMHNGIVTESFGYPELRGVSLSAYLRDKTGLPCMAARDMQVVAAATRRSTRPHRKPSCVFTSASWAQAQVSCWTERSGAVPQALPVNYTICRLNTISNTRRITLQALPEQAMPVIELSRSFEQDYTRGLFTLAKKMEETT